jgi:hypothetical protein
VFPLQIGVRIAIVLEAPVGGVRSLLLLTDPAEVLQHKKQVSMRETTSIPVEDLPEIPRPYLARRRVAAAIRS